MKAACGNRYIPASGLLTMMMMMMMKLLMDLLGNLQTEHILDLSNQVALRHRCDPIHHSVASGIDTGCEFTPPSRRKSAKCTTTFTT